MAYNGDVNDDYRSLIHVSKADPKQDYYCPCCGNKVRARALDSTKVQSHYYHFDEGCSRESQLHYICKSWLFAPGSKFKIGKKLFAVKNVEIERPEDTDFGLYIPDITVTTEDGIIIYFEMFFSCRKRGTDYFCKWDYLGNDVVEVNVKEYVNKQFVDDIPEFRYLYHNGKCYSKEYCKRDIYANTIAKVKTRLTRQQFQDYQIRIQKLDWFWRMVADKKPDKDILESISCMEYDDMLVCYDIVKKVQCVKHLKDKVAKEINRKLFMGIIEKYNLNSYDCVIKESVHTGHYFIRQKFYYESDHITSDNSISCFSKEIYIRKKILTEDDFKLNEKEISKIKEYKENSIKSKEEYDKIEEYIKSKNIDLIIHDEKCILKIDNDLFEFYIHSISLDDLIYKVDYYYIEHVIKTDKRYIELIDKLSHYKDIGLSVYVETKDNKFFSIWGNYEFNLFFIKKFTLQDEIDYIEKECVNDIDNKYKAYEKALLYDKKINNCKNGFWRSSVNFYGDDIKLFIETKEYYGYSMVTIKSNYSDEQIKEECLKGMNRLIKRLEKEQNVRFMWRY